MTVPHTVLNNGVKMPWLGLGVWRAANGPEVESAVVNAIRNGYRSIDTAAGYGNEEGVGNGVRQSGVPREAVFITTKVANGDQGYDPTLKAFELSCRKLGLDYIDLYLIHWPVPGKYKDTWRAMERLYASGLVRAIGVSNFLQHHLQDVMKDSDIVPAVNQVEFHPCLADVELVQYCKDRHIQFESWSPLMRGQLMDHPMLNEIGSKYGKTAAQIMLRWNVQQGIVTIPKSVSPERIKSNAAIFDFALTEEEMAHIFSLNSGRRLGPHPDRVNF